ncbi:MAG: Gfo/Idh/MocA family oxidoreductase [Planctomycetota bacterium]|jgi:predicted dehydrogenase|nr:Gfo/Idh/MocA family oxidoreductase [Planctomycetota bacterium]
MRCCIIGCGPGGKERGGAHSIAYAHAWAYQAQSETILVAAASRSAANRETWQHEFADCQMYANYREMLTEVAPEMVSICAFPPDRVAMVTAACQAGAKIIWAEKPFAVTVADGEAMLAAAAHYGARLYVNHQRRYGEVCRWFREAACDGRIGELLQIDIVQPGGCLENFGPHLLDQALAVLGARSPTHVIATADCSSGTVYQGLPTQDHLLASVHYADGVRLTVELGDHHLRSPLLRAHGTDGFAELHVNEQAGMASVFRCCSHGHCVNPPSQEHFHHGKSAPNLFYNRALTAILKATADGTACELDATEAHKGAVLIAGIHAACASGTRLTFPILPPHHEVSP